MNIHLGRGEANTGRGVHRIEHVINQLAQPIIKLSHGLRHGPKAGVWIFENFEYCHRFLAS